MLATVGALLTEPQLAMAQRLKLRSSPESATAETAAQNRDGERRKDGQPAPTPDAAREAHAPAPAEATEFRSVTTSEISAEPFRHIGKIGNKQAPSAAWATGTLIGPRHVLTSGAELLRLGGPGNLQFVLPDGRGPSDIVDFTVIQGPPSEHWNMAVAILKDPLGADHKHAHARALLPEEQVGTDSQPVFPVRATGYDSPAQGVPVALNKATRGLIHRTGTVTDRPPDIDILIAALDGAYRGYKTGKEFDEAGPMKFNGSGKSKKGVFTFGIDEEPAGIGGRTLGLFAGLAFGMHAGSKALSTISAVDGFAWNDGATGGPIWVWDAGSRDKASIVGIMSVVTGIDGRLGLGTFRQDVSYGAELIYAHGEENIQAFIEQNP